VPKLPWTVEPTGVKHADVQNLFNHRFLFDSTDLASELQSESNQILSCGEKPLEAQTSLPTELFNSPWPIKLWV
jgi:hypothetical protein